MIAHQTSFTEAMSLDDLADYLMSDSSPAESMLLSDLDGFLTGIAVGPEAIPPDEWLPVIWGETAPQFDDESQAQAVLGAILGRYDEIVRQIDNETVEPIFWQSGDTVIAWDWADGFVESFALRQRHWTKMLKSEAAILLVPIMMLCDPENLPDELALEEKERVIDDAIDSLPTTPFWPLRPIGVCPSSKRKASLLACARLPVPAETIPARVDQAKNSKNAVGLAPEQP